MSSAGEKKKVIIDTDPGVDDAMAIIMALDAHKRQQIEIIAITLVKGNASLKDAERNILRVLETFGLENRCPIQLLDYASMSEFSGKSPLHHAYFGPHHSCSCHASQAI